MTSVIGDLLPLAVGVAISPIPIVAVILMLLSRNASATGTGFAAGWVAGILVATTIFVLLSGSIGSTRSSGSSPAVSWIRIGLGVLLLALAVKQWRARADASTPGWMAALDGFTVVKAAGLGAALSALNPKNLLLCVSAGVAIGTGGLSGAGKAVAVLIYTVLAAVTVTVPAIGYLFAADRVRGSLDALKNWLQANNHMVMAIVMLVMGTVVIGKGIGGL